MIAIEDVANKPSWIITKLKLLIKTCRMLPDFSRILNRFFVEDVGDQVPDPEGVGTHERPLRTPEGVFYPTMKVKPFVPSPWIGVIYCDWVKKGVKKWSVTQLDRVNGTLRMCVSECLVSLAWICPFDRSLRSIRGGGNATNSAGRCTDMATSGNR